MIKITKSQLQAKKLLSEHGFDDLTGISFDLFISGLGITYIEEELNNCDGKIIFGEGKTIIKINSKIPYLGRKRFATAHEIGHFVIHKGLLLPDDNFKTLNIIEGTEKYLKYGIQEMEANEFASELLMPSHIFKKEAANKRFSPQLLKVLSDRFKTSITATAFKYLQMNLHPICIILTENGKVRFWKKSEDLKVWVGDITKLPPPDGSVAREYVQADYDFLYAGEEKGQNIFKSTWFNLNGYETDSVFYEYCIPTKAYSTILSIIWEN